MAEQGVAERPKLIRFMDKLPTQVQFGERLRLRVAQGGNAGASYCLLADVIVIGRDETCDIALQDDKASRRHVELVWKKDKYFARDLDSANGLLVNQKRVKGVFLEPGDIVTIGNSEIEVIASGRQSQLGTVLQTAKGATKANEEEQKLRKKRNIVFGAIFLLAMIAFSGSEQVLTFKERAYMTFTDQEKPEKKLSKKEGKEAIQDFVPGGSSESPGFKSAQRFYRDGMRELQNKNYRRAIAAFETAQTVDPTHELARVYVEIARKALEDEINYNFRAAIAAVNAHRFKQARAYYETVVRLLEKDPNNKVYTESKEAIEKLDKLAEKGK